MIKAFIILHQLYTLPPCDADTHVNCYISLQLPEDTVMEAVTLDNGKHYVGQTKEFAS